MCIELHKKFDIAEVTTEIADKLRKHELTIKGIQSKAIYEIGEELKAAHDELANHNGGIFYAWCESIGIGVGTVKNIMNYHQMVSKNFTNRTMLEELPKSLVYAAAKPSAPPELTQKVLDGEITTHKQWQEKLKAMKERTEQAERRAEQAEQANEALTAQYNEQAEQLQDLRNNPQVIEKDSAETTRELWNLRGENKQLQDKVEALEQQTNESDFKDMQIQDLQNKNRKLEQQMEEYKAHSRGQTLHEYAMEKASRQEEYSHLIKTREEEAKMASDLREFIQKTQLLPQSPIEMRESLRCWLQDESEGVRALDRLKRMILVAEERLAILKDTIDGKDNKPRLEVIK